MSLTSPLNLGLAEKLRNRLFRSRFFLNLARKEVAAQIRRLRERRGLTQVEFAKMCRMKQSAVSRIEQADYSGWTFKTLARVAEKLDAQLRITLEPAEDVIERLATQEGRLDTYGNAEAPEMSAATTMVSKLLSDPSGARAVLGQQHPYDPVSALPLDKSLEFRGLAVPQERYLE